MTDKDMEETLATLAHMRAYLEVFTENKLQPHPVFAVQLGCCRFAFRLIFLLAWLIGAAPIMEELGRTDAQMARVSALLPYSPILSFLVECFLFACLVFAGYAAARVVLYVLWAVYTVGVA